MNKLLYDVQEKRDGSWHSWGKYAEPEILLRAIEYYLGKAWHDPKRRSDYPELRAIPVIEETIYRCE